MTDQNPYEALKTREIYDIFIGDKAFGTYKFEDDGDECQICMPYMRGQDLCDLLTKFGEPTEYPWSGALSRWMYMENLITHCVEKNLCPELLKYFFSKEHFRGYMTDHSADATQKAYDAFVSTIIEKINGTLYFGGYELVWLNGQYIVKELNEAVEIETPQLQTIDSDYIRSMAERANRDVDSGEYDSAITKSRTLLEEVFCYAVEVKGESPVTNGNIQTLYRQVKDLYNMHGDRNTDVRINKLLSGLEKIVSSIAEMRNHNSDAHGVGQARIGLRDYHARLFVNAAMTMADFILSVAEYNLSAIGENVNE